MRWLHWLPRSALTAGALSVLLAVGLDAQTAEPALQVEGVGEPVVVQMVRHRGYPAFPAWALRTLGARVDATARGVRVAFAADTLQFDAGSPFFTVGGRAWQLVHAPYREGGIFYLPGQLFTEWLPGAYPQRVAYVDGRLHLRDARVADTSEPIQAADPAPAAVPSPSRAAPDPAPREAPLGQPSMTPLVVIDPGHGGVDPGRVGPGGLREKDVVLAVSRRLATELARRGYEVRMTRTTDTLVSLADRPQLANQWRGTRPGLFLSIHANGVSDQRVRGFETFFLSEARTEDERRVAEMENSAAQYESVDRVVGSDDLDFILNNLRNDYYIRASHDLAGLVQDSFRGFHSGPNRGVKQAGFRVLVGAFMPAVLIELAFISNRAEERLLGSAAFQERSVRAIADAVDRFFQKQGELWQTPAP
jgi:N-acetylmuramoyl-L-alanine amidase